MRCVDPFVRSDGEIFSCGRCLPCSARKRAEWFHRCLLEASCHESSSGLTLTYDEENNPADGNLRPEDLRNWLKRIRRYSVERFGLRVRYYACGEYGEKNGRPHFHVLLFGYPSCRKGRTGSQWCGDCKCVSCSGVNATWDFGASSLVALDKATCAYVCGYVSRKILTKEDCLGKVPPFTRMSRCPGIGANAMWDVASGMMRYGLEKKGIPSVLSHGSNMLPLGKYLRSKIGKYVDQEGYEMVKSPDQERRMSLVRNYAAFHGLSVRSVLAEVNAPYNSQLYQRAALKEKKL